ncbi:dual specificity protein phosphatase PHS1 [Cinnamomum micranthum f. kanehirae]|uniref:Dual specificity protein phosphatase PHS1 n=1 Tax=Cinnamomum micranthum f. kanehirae TaxID=337451 RepID=A0A3S3MB23_9MAGN|nr:dual specificity protein phosphatase PHS1 [Cinnamomum micranthum f. kanehirae]
MAQDDQYEEQQDQSQKLHNEIEASEQNLQRSSDPAETGISSRVLFLLGDITAGPAYRFARWLESVRRRSGRYRSSGFPSRSRRLEDMPFGSLSFNRPHSEETLADSVDSFPSEHTTEISLWERLGKAAMLDIESSEFSWHSLSSLHHTEHSSGSEFSEDEVNKAVEVIVNSGGVVFFALFSIPENDDRTQEAASVIKISSSRMATQSERLGYELAKWLGVQTPQARVIHSSNSEWQCIKDAAEIARDAALSEGDEIGQMTCSELLEALEMSRCLLLMNYVHGSPLLESPNAFDSREAAEKTAAGLSRILMLDLVIRNEDRLPCRQLGWRGNYANLLFADKVMPANTDVLDESFGSSLRSYRPRIVRALQKERRCISMDGRLSPSKPGLMSQSSDVSDVINLPEASHSTKMNQVPNELKSSDFHIVAIDSGVPRRPPAGKRANDQAHYPKLVELILNSAEYSSNLLYEITGGKMGVPIVQEAAAPIDSCTTDISTIVHEFRAGFRAALRDLQGFHIFLLTIYQKLDGLLRAFLSIIEKSSSGDIDKDDTGISASLSQAPASGANYYSPVSKEQFMGESQADLSDSELQKTAPRSSSSGCRESPDSHYSISRENWHGRFSKGSGEPFRSLRLTMKLRDFNKYAKIDAELHRELEQWNELLRTDVVKLCQENNFNTGFFEGTDNSSVIDAYELKVRLEHILERIALISDAANTERPSSVTAYLFIGGALAAKSVYTLQHLGITHILCLCANEIGQSDSQHPDLFEYRNFSICDDDNAKISDIFEEASDFIENVETSGKKVLVHCFEGRSRSATVVLAYLMLRKNFTLLEAWTRLKRVHRRAQPNDGFAKILLDFDRKLHGKASMEWQHKKPAMKVCPICGKDAGLSSSSLKLHLQKSHKKISSGSVDSAMTMEIQKALVALKISQGSSISPNQKQPQ